MKLVKKNKFTIIAVVLFIIFMLGVSEIKKVFFSKKLLTFCLAFSKIYARQKVR